MQEVLSIFAKRWALVAAMCLGAVPVYAAHPTQTALTLTASGSTPASVASGTVITLTASVKQVGNYSPVTQGQVIFCVATGHPCSQLNMLGIAQLTPAGTAEIKLRPGAGPANYAASFVNQSASGGDYGPSNSLTASVAVVGQTSMSLAASGPTLTASVTGIGAIAPTGDLSYSASSVAWNEASLGQGKVAQTFTNLAPNDTGGEAPLAVAVGDFNGDGIPDLAVTVHFTLQIWLGLGNGTFAAPVLYPAGQSADSIVVGDFNGDGIADVAVANSSEGNIETVLGRGDGTFGNLTTYSTGFNSFPASLAVGDFNRDGIADLAFVDCETNSAGVLLGKGNGTFSVNLSNEMPLNAGAVSVAVGDFNRDGIPDLVVAEEVGTVGVLLGVGNGTFKAEVEYPAGAQAQWVAMGDFNGDGIPDVVVANGAANSVGVLLGKGDGTLMPQTAYPAGYIPQSVALGDFNGDGIADVAVADGDGHVSVLLGKGDGTLNPRYVYSDGSWIIGLAAGDFNGDGATDLVGADTGDYQLNVLQNSLTATSTATMTISDVPFLDLGVTYPGDTYHDMVQVFYNGR